MKKIYHKYLIMHCLDYINIQNYLYYIYIYNINRKCLIYHDHKTLNDSNVLNLNSVVFISKTT